MIIVPPNEFWMLFKSIPGALSCCESLAIMNICSKVVPGTYIELGSHKGKSAVSAIAELPNGVFNLVDPMYEGNTLGIRVSQMVRQVTNKDIVVPYIAGYSTDILKEFDNLSYVLVDSGSHQDGLPMAEVKMLEDKMISGGIIAFHDFGNQFREPKEAAEYLVETGKYEWLEINWDEIINYVKEYNLEDGNESWHVYADNPFPNFVGAIRRK